MRKEIFYTYLSLISSVVGVIFASWYVKDDASPLLYTLYVYSLGILFLGNLVYALSRLGYLKRLQSHKKVSEKRFFEKFSTQAPSLQILVPSYCEEPEVIKQTLLSSMLQLYPHRSVALLIDDDPGKVSLSELLAEELKQQFSWMRKRFDENLLEDVHLDVAEWLLSLAKCGNCHVSKFFWKQTIAPIVERVLRESTTGETTLVRQLFSVELSYFQRKKYVNLSHAKNKAMNINSYLSLMGKRFDAEQDLLVERSEGDLFFPDAKYVAVLDADTLLDPLYAARLIFEMEKKKNAKVAVIQTPYSAFPEAPGILEKIAGATTDIQYIIHQGFTYFGATFWVGANALIRKCSLEEIKEVHSERGYPVVKYIQDRTVIEDTESSVDLVEKGWRLHNYPERLSYSATPPDFGALLIQRRRWANGGLLILPKLLRYLLQKPFSGARVLECLLRFHYLFSLAGSLIAVAFLTILGTFSEAFFLGSALLALPYLLLYGRDMTQCGYSLGDTFRVIALNVLLIPVNLAGVVKSLHQGVTGRQTPFYRTPKVEGRTAVPAFYLYFLLGLALFAVRGVASVLTLVLCVLPLYYGIVKFVRLSSLLEDLKPQKVG